MANHKHIDAWIGWRARDKASADNGINWISTTEPALTGMMRDFPSVPRAIGKGSHWDLGGMSGHISGC